MFGQPTRSFLDELHEQTQESFELTPESDTMEYVYIKVLLKSTCTYSYILIHTYIHKYINIFIHTQTYSSTHMHTYFYILIYTHIYSYILILILTYTYSYIPIHTYTHSYMYKGGRRKLFTRSCRTY